MERREHPRIPGQIEAHMLIGGKRHARGQLLDLSAGGLRLACEAPVEIGERVIAHLNGGARFEGTVARLVDGGFAVKLEMTEAKRQRLAAHLDVLMRDDHSPLKTLASERRVSPRVAANHTAIRCECEDGAFGAKIIDMSLTGIAIETTHELDIGALVVVGKMRGVVARRDGDVYGVNFANGGGQPLKHPASIRSRDDSDEIAAGADITLLQRA